MLCSRRCCCRCFLSVISAGDLRLSSPHHHKGCPIHALALGAWVGTTNARTHTVHALLSPLLLSLLSFCHLRRGPAPFLTPPPQRVPHSCASTWRMGGNH